MASSFVDLSSCPGFRGQGGSGAGPLRQGVRRHAVGADEFVICADEKTSVQARCRCHPTLPPGRSRLMRVEHEYDRRGAVAYLAAYDVHRAQVFGRAEGTTGIEPFGRGISPSSLTSPSSGC